MERRLTAILAADVVGYSRLMGEDEVGTLARLKACRRELVDPAIEQFHGRIVKLMGDGALVEFASVVDAVQCAADIQRRMPVHQRDVADARRIRFRVGVNLGDIIVDGDDIYGNGVNIAARLESESEPGGICISGTAFDHALHKTDVGFASLGEQRLKNIADPVRVYRVLLDPKDAGKVVAAPRRRVPWMVLAGATALLLALVAFVGTWRQSAPTRPSVAILPFANLSGDPSQDYFADGITEDLITDLAKLSGLDVIARNSAFAYKGKQLGLEAIARELDVRFVVEGSVRRNGDDIRINAQLVDTATGDHLWADRFDRKASEVFAVQDEISREIVKSLGMEPTIPETERMARPPTADLEAYDYYLRAEQVARQGVRTELKGALQLYDKAIELDPAFAEAYAADARTAVYIWRSTFDDVLQSAPARKRAYEKASRALALDQDLSSPYAVLGIMQAVDRRYEESLASAQQAVALGPADVDAQMALAYANMVAGKHGEAAAAVDTALRLDPNLAATDRLVAGLVFFLARDTARAIEAYERAHGDAPGNVDIMILLSAAYAAGGRIDDAREMVAKSRLALAGADSIAGWNVSFAHFREADLDYLVAALREAGIPEWPFGFSADERDRLKGEEIAGLVLGKQLQGKTEPRNGPAIMQIDADGRAAFRSATQMITEHVFIDGDSMCEQSESLFGRADCGPVYRRANAADAFAYIYVNSSKVFHFSPVE
jgi:adenylate cyclase